MADELAVAGLEEVELVFEVGADFEGVGLEVLCEDGVEDGFPVCVYINNVGVSVCVCVIETSIPHHSMQIDRNTHIYTYPMATLRLEPPKVLKYSIPLVVKASAISRRATTALCVFFVWLCV